MKEPAGEREWMNSLMAALGVYGYATKHDYPLRTEHGWRTGSTANGFPDIMAVRGMYVLFIETKGVRTSVEAEQLIWLARLAMIPTARCWILRPQDDWGSIQRWMRKPEGAPRRYGWTQERAAAALERIERKAAQRRR